MSESGHLKEHPKTFPKKERLSSKKHIEELFKNGSSFYLHPLLVKFRPASDSAEPCHKALFTVPKKNFKKAVHRNLLKRRMREAYRLHKEGIAPGRDGIFYHLAFVYLDKSLLPYAQIEEKLKALLQRLPNRNPQENADQPGQEVPGGS